MSKNVLLDKVVARRGVPQSPIFSMKSMRMWTTKRLRRRYINQWVMRKLDHGVLGSGVRENG